MLVRVNFSFGQKVVFPSRKIRMLLHAILKTQIELNSNIFNLEMWRK